MVWKWPRGSIHVGIPAKVFTDSDLMVCRALRSRRNLKSAKNFTYCGKLCWLPALDGVEAQMLPLQLALCFTSTKVPSVLLSEWDCKCIPRVSKNVVPPECAIKNVENRMDSREERASFLYFASNPEHHGIPCRWACYQPLGCMTVSGCVTNGTLIPIKTSISIEMIWPSRTIQSSNYHWLRVPGYFAAGNNLSV